MTAHRRRITAFAAAHFAISALTLASTRYGGGGLALVWLGSAVAITLLLGLPRRRWPVALGAIMAASALAISLFGFGPRLAPALALLNAAEAWLIARLLVFVRPGRDWLDRLDGLFWLVAVGGVIGPAITAIPAGVIVSQTVLVPWAEPALSWWAAHGLGTLIGLPLALLLARADLSGWRERRTRRGGLVLAGHLALVLAVSLATLAQTALPLLFLPLVPVLLAALRCGRAGAALGMLIMAAVTIYALATGRSPADGTTLGMAGRVLFMQLYLATVTLMVVPAAVALHQHLRMLGELEERKALKRLISEHSNDALLNLDPHGRIRFASTASERLSGSGDLEGQPLAIFFDPLDELPVRGLLAQAAAAPGETCTLERPVVRGDEQLWLEARVCAVAPPEGGAGNRGALQGFAVTVRDVTASKQAELAAIQAAETDPLTGLANRRALLRHLERSLAHAGQRPFALAIVDLDHFKAVNDTHGHLTGDAVLREVAGLMHRLAGCGRFFARLGGEEFAMVITDGEPGPCRALAEELRAAIAALILAAPGGAAVRVTASIGIARIDRPVSLAQALQSADALLYRAKHAGRDRVEANLAETPAPAPARAHRRKAA